MDGIITEKDYPVRDVWVLKSIFYFFPAYIILLIYIFTYFWLDDVPEKSVNVSDFYPFLFFTGFIIFNTILTVLMKANFHYSIEEKYLTLKQGIISKKQRYIPYGVIQNLFVNQDLFDRIFGLASLTIENASQGSGVLSGEERVFGLRFRIRQRQRVGMIGFFANKIIIPGLTKANAEVIKGVILQKMKENPIDDNQSGL